MVTEKQFIERLGSVDMDRIETPMEEFKRYDGMLSFLMDDAVQDGMSEWEIDFVYDLTTRISPEKRLSTAQKQKLEELWLKYN